MPTRSSRLTPAALLLIAGAALPLSAAPFPASFDLSSLDGTNGFVINGIDESDQSGRAVSAAGDVDGDGVDDLIIGAPFADPSGMSNAGETYVIYGGAGIGASGTIELASLGIPSLTINGVDAGDRSGGSVSAAGDLNGDGIGDLIIGAYLAEVTQDSQGESYVVFGSGAGGAGVSLDLALLNGSNGFTIFGAIVGSQSGRSVSAAGDLNGDGFDDVIIGAHRATEAGAQLSGESYVVFGGADAGSGGSVDLMFLDGSNGFLIDGIETNDFSGYSVSSAGDFNSDGIDDVIIGSMSDESYLVFGDAAIGASGTLELSSLDGTNGFIMTGEDDSRVSGAGDINNDGVDDVIIGVAGFGAAVVFGGAGVGAGGSLDLTALDGTDGFIIQRDNMGGFIADRLGYSVSAAGDVNGDGIEDLIVGTMAVPAFQSNIFDKGYVIFGGDGIGAGGTLALSLLDGTNGFVINGIDLSDGAVVSAAGDVNDDGVADLIIGSPGADPNGASASGESYIVFGRADCTGDLNGDGVVDTADLGALIGQFGTAGPDADLNGDGVVDTADLGALIGAFGTTCI